MNIVVLCGGLSAERDVSISSGRKISDALRSKGHRALLVDVFFGYTGSYTKPEDVFSAPYEDSSAIIGESAPDLEAVKNSRNQDNDSRIGDNVVEICRAADIVFMALHGEDGENGKLQALFDIMGVKYTGCGYLGSALAMNKEVAKSLFIQNGILTPPGWTAKKGGDNPAYPGYPVVVKPRSGGSSVGTSIARSAEEYEAALRLSFQYEDYALVEKYIQGRECDVGVIAGRALPVIEICPKTGFYDYKNKYQKGLADEYCPADLPTETTEKLLRSAEAVFSALMLEVYARMDFMVDAAGDVYCLEANTLPGMTPTSLLPQEAAAVGISYEDLCELIIAESMKKYA